MSKVKIQGNASGTGTLTISAPNTNTDRTLTLPDGAGEIVVSSGGALPSLDGSSLTGIAGGKTIQTVYTGGVSSSGIGTTTQQSWVDAGFNLSITPTDASNYILVRFLSSMADSTSTAQYTWSINNSTSGNGSYGVGYLEYDKNRYAGLGAEFIYNPSDTSAVEFDVAMYSGSTSGTYLVFPSATYFLIAQEITL